MPQGFIEGRGMGLAEISPLSLGIEQPLILPRLITEAAAHQVGGFHPGEAGGPS